MVGKQRMYLNCRTAQTTGSREIAWEWYHAGDSIECWVNGHLAVRMAGAREMGFLEVRHA